MKRKTRRQIREVIKRGIRKRKELAEFNSFLKLLRTKEIEMEFGIFCTVIVFNIENLNELKKIRKILRREFETWEDILISVDCWYSGMSKDYWVTFNWKGKYLPIQICFQSLYKNLPEELKNLKKGCKFLETITPIEAQGATESKSLSYICETK